MYGRCYRSFSCTSCLLVGVYCCQDLRCSVCRESWVVELETVLQGKKHSCEMNFRLDKVDGTGIYDCSSVSQSAATEDGLSRRINRDEPTVTVR